MWRKKYNWINPPTPLRIKFLDRFTLEYFLEKILKIVKYLYFHYFRIPKQIRDRLR